MPLSMIYYLLILIGVLVSVSFYTLFERKTMGLSHIRTGPMVAGVMGVMQPFADAVKLFTKESPSISQSNHLIYVISPVIILGTAFLVWLVPPISSGMFSFKALMLVFFITSSVSVYAHMGCGWGSNSVYAMIGGLRCVAQSVSYEVSLVILFTGVMMIGQSVDLTGYYRVQEWCPWVCILLPLSMAWWVSSVAETNRTPFDFAEGESELVSGFNVEYGGGKFALLFMAEYGSMIFMSVLMTFLFFGGVCGPIWWSLTGMFLYLYVWMRVSFPRTRYDKLMMLGWWILLPCGVSYCIFVLGVVG